MKTLLKIVIALLLVSPLIGYAAEIDVKPQTDITELKGNLRAVAHDVEILRRDQTNYKIEKDLLKEAYSSNLERINLIITFVLGIIGVVGYLGVRSIKEIKADYSKELDTLRTMKSEFESELQLLTNEQKIVANQVTNLAKTNEAQDRRLKVLELIEKVDNLVRDRQWGWAQEFIDVGLGLDSANTQLLEYKAMCHGKLGEFTSQIETSKKVLELEPQNTSMVCNLLEVYAIRREQASFDQLYNNHKTQIDAMLKGAVSAYLGGVFKLMNGQNEEAAEQLSRFVDTCHDRPKPYLGETWAFDEIKWGVSDLPAGNQKTLLLKTIDFFKGTLSPADYKTVLATA